MIDIDMGTVIWYRCILDMQQFSNTYTAYSSTMTKQWVILHIYLLMLSRLSIRQQRPLQIRVPSQPFLRVLRTCLKLGHPDAQIFLCSSRSSSPPQIMYQVPRDSECGKRSVDSSGSSERKTFQAYHTNAKGALGSFGITSQRSCSLVPESQVTR